MRFAFNHILAPKLPLKTFFAKAKSLGATEVEIRNDLPDIVGATAPEKVREAAEKAGVTIVSINALYPFNVWSGDLPTRATALADYAQRCGAKAIVMCPLNTGEPVPPENAIEALQAFRCPHDAQRRKRSRRSKRSTVGTCTRSSTTPFTITLLARRRSFPNGRGWFTFPASAT